MLEIAIDKTDFCFCFEVKKDTRSKAYDVNI